MKQWMRFRSGGAKEGEEAALKRWYRNVDVFSLSKLFVPICHDNWHWTLLMVDFDNKIIRYFDSGRYTDGEMYLRAMKEWLQKEWRASQQGKFPSGWGRLGTTRDTPKQTSSCDCGLFLAFSANYLSVGAPLNFSQDDMEHLRRRMTIDILHAKIYEGSPAKQKSVTWAPQLEPAAAASSKLSKKRPAPPRRDASDSPQGICVHKIGPKWWAI